MPKQTSVNQNINSQSNKNKYHDAIANFLKKQLNLGARFYLLKSNEELKAIRFDVDKLKTEEGIEFIDCLLEEEKSGNKILISYPNQGLKKVSFLQEN